MIFSLIAIYDHAKNEGTVGILWRTVDGQTLVPSFSSIIRKNKIEICIQFHLPFIYIFTFTHSSQVEREKDTVIHPRRMPTITNTATTTTTTTITNTMTTTSTTASDTNTTK